MSTPELACADERRREDVRRADLNGLDYLEVSDDGRALTVCFLGKAPSELSEGNVRIDGGPAARAVTLAGSPTIHRSDHPDFDDCMEVRLAHPGDRSAYTLRMVEADEKGRPTTRPLHGFDPRYASLAFSFAVVCPSDLDCVTGQRCPPERPHEPEADYLAKDYASFRQLILDRLSLVMPDWQERHVPDIGITLVELLAYAGDHLSYTQDAVATEAYLQTARHRVSVRRHARLVDYAMHEGCNARVFVCLRAAQDKYLVDLSALQFLALHQRPPAAPAGGSPRGTPDAWALPYGSYEVFEPAADEGAPPFAVRKAHEAIAFHTWGNRECCLPAGTTTATLVDRWLDEPSSENTPERDESRPDRARALHLQAGDVLIFEEVKGPATGREADADRTRRHAIRLTSVTADVDPLYDAPHGRPVVRVEWDGEDALPFTLCLSALGPDCELIDGISVARGNVVLADHGRTVHREPLGEVETATATPCCAGEGRPGEMTVTAKTFTPALEQSPVTTAARPLSPVPASRMLIQDPRQALPWLHLREHGGDAPPGGWAWCARRDLLDSGASDRHVVVEVDDEGHAHLRFGDGRLGRRPEAGTRFSASYRVGNGPAGNVGADAITLVRDRQAQGKGTRNSPVAAELSVRNPLAATGGVAPEPVSDVKAMVPMAFRTRLERAVTAADYATLAQRTDVAGTGRVQGAAATARWTGSWEEILVALDAAGEVRADDDLVRHVARGLYRYRRIGHDLVVAPAEDVPLFVALSICLLPGHVKGHVRAALLDALSNRELANGRRGYFHPDNLTIGQNVTVSGLTAAAQAVPGVQSVQVTSLERLYQGPQHEIEEGVMRLGPTEVARLDNDPGNPEHGVLTLDIKGGR